MCQYQIFNFGVASIRYDTVSAKIKYVIIGISGLVAGNGGKAL